MKASPLTLKKELAQEEGDGVASFQTRAPNKAIDSGQMPSRRYAKALRLSVFVGIVA